MHVKLSKLNYMCELLLRMLLSIFYFGLLGLSTKHAIYLPVLCWNWITCSFFVLGFRKTKELVCCITKNIWPQKENCTHCQVCCKPFSLSPPLSLSAHFKCMKYSLVLTSRYPPGGARVQSVSGFPLVSIFCVLYFSQYLFPLKIDILSLHSILPIN